MTSQIKSPKALFRVVGSIWTACTVVVVLSFSTALYVAQRAHVEQLPSQLEAQTKLLLGQ